MSNSDDLIHDSNGWYFWMRERVCRIGPYRDEGECRRDWGRYVETGRVSLEVGGTVGVSRCPECEGV